MRKIKIFALLLVPAVSAGCSNDDDLATALGLAEAVYINTTTPMALLLNDNETLQLTPFIMPVSAANKTVGYENLSPDIYDITPEGLITPLVIEGDGYLRVFTTDGSNLSVTYLVRISDHVIHPTAISVAMTAERITLGLDPPGDSFDLGVLVTLTPANAENMELVYTSENTAVAAVTADGVVTPVAEGETSIVITPADNKNDISVAVPVSVIAEVQKVESIEIAQEAQAIGLAPYTTYNLGNMVTVLPADAYDLSVRYASSDESVATVNAQGLITAISGGSATITVTAADGSNVTAACGVTVVEDFDRTDWTVTVEPLAAMSATPDASIGGNDPMYLIDGATYLDTGKETCLALYKPGRAGNPAELEGQTLFFVLDMQSRRQFNYVRIRHRTDLVYTYLRVDQATFYGSNDGVDFEKIIPDTALGGAANTDGQVNTNPGDETVLNVHIPFGQTVGYRYLKMTYDSWNTGSGGMMQIAEFNVGLL